jgi:hypothetical protein
MEPYRVFISSIINQSIEDLSAERQVVKSAVERSSPITVAWAFEAEPASPKPLLDFYLDAVKTCDAFILILGQRLTKPVRDEVQVALDYRKPMLAFCKRVQQRDPESEELLRAMDVKYDLFANAVELHEMIRQSIGGHLLEIVRGQPGGEVKNWRSSGAIAELCAPAQDGEHLSNDP